jgi:transposase-like zinc-binding protein
MGEGSCANRERAPPVGGVYRIERFIWCGDPHHGFARIYCDACGHDYLLAYSCKTRYFCPSCHQKRVLLYGEWVEENVLEPVAHRQYVFTVPRLLRPIFAQPHVHVLAADGAFAPDGRFMPLPAVPEALLAEGFRYAVLGFLGGKGAVSRDLRRKLTFRSMGRGVHILVSFSSRLRKPPEVNLRGPT